MSNLHRMSYDLAMALSQARRGTSNRWQDLRVLPSEQLGAEKLIRYWVDQGWIFPVDVEE